MEQEEALSSLFECDVCQRQCGSKSGLEEHVKEHVKKRKKADGSKKAYYLGSNSFGQIPDFSKLSCEVPHLIKSDFSLLSCNFSSIAWIDSKNVLTCSGFSVADNCVREPRSVTLDFEVIQLFHAFGNVGVVTKEEVLFLSPSGEDLVFKAREDIKKINSVQIQKIVCCGKALYCLAENGKVYNLTEANNRSELAIPGKVVLFSCGEEHCLAVTQEKEVFSWGNSFKGQLGRGTLKEEPAPTRIPALGGLDIIQIACGKWHNVALTREGDLYVWGWNKYGQLGLPCPDYEDIMSSIETSTTMTAEPILLDFQIGVKRVACGSSHTIVLADDGSVWGCGFTKFGQLGAQTEEKIDKLTPLKLKVPGEIVDVVACNWSTIIYVN